MGLAGVVALLRIEDAAERSYIKRCVEHRADTCGGDDHVKARAFCEKNPMAYVDNPAPVEHMSEWMRTHMSEADKRVNGCNTAYLYHHRNDGLFGGLIKF